MDLEQQVGQMLMAGFRGTGAERDDPILRDITEYNLGSVVLFDYDVLMGEPGRNIESLEQVQVLLSTLQSHAEIPLLVSVDQEGGRVRRLKETLGFPPMPSARELGASGDSSATQRVSEATAAALAALGINLNLAPVVDLNTNPDNPIIGAKERSFSASASVVVGQARAFIEGHHREGVLCALKHFPGHGSSAADSHLGLVDITEGWSRDELEPYSRLLAEGKVDAIMTAHVFNRALDAEYPATLSAPVLTGMLRGELGFDGVVISDDLQMGAIANHYGFAEALLKAIEAGVDILALANNTLYDRDVVPKACAAIARMVEDGRIARERIAASCARIARLKTHLKARA